MCVLLHYNSISLNLFTATHFFLCFSLCVFLLPLFIFVLSFSLFSSILSLFCLLHFIFLFLFPFSSSISYPSLTHALLFLFSFFSFLFFSLSSSSFFLFLQSLGVIQRTLGMEHPRAVVLRRNVSLARTALLRLPRTLPDASRLPPLPEPPVFNPPAAKKAKKAGKKSKKKWEEGKEWRIYLHIYIYIYERMNIER